LCYGWGDERQSKKHRRYFLYHGHSPFDSYVSLNWHRVLQQREHEPDNPTIKAGNQWLK
jgi:hypothetical protein